MNTKRKIPSFFLPKPLNRNIFLQELKRHGERENIPNISWETATILRFFLSLVKPKKVLEIGCANGFSTVFIADILEEWNGTILSLERSIPSLAQAKENVQKAQLHNVSFRFGDALELLEPEDEVFDFIFIDAEKKMTHLFFEMGEQFLASGGIVFIDDFRKFPEKMAPFYKMLEEKKETWEMVEIPTEEGDAVMVMTPLSFPSP